MSLEVVNADGIEYYLGQVFWNIDSDRSSITQTEKAKIQVILNSTNQKQSLQLQFGAGSLLCSQSYTFNTTLTNAYKNSKTISTTIKTKDCLPISSTAASTAAAVSTASQILNLAGGVVGSVSSVQSAGSLGSSLASAGSGFSGLFVLLVTMDVLNLIPFINLDYSTSLQTFFNLISSSPFPNPFEQAQAENTDYDSTFGKYCDLQSQRSFLLGSGVEVAQISIYYLIMLVLIFISLCQNKTKKAYKFVVGARNIFLVLPLITVISGIVSDSQAFFLNLVDLQLNDGLEIAGIITAAVWVVALTISILLLVYTMRRLQNANNRDKLGILISTLNKQLLEEYKDNELVCKCFILFTCCRNILLSFIVFVGQDLVSLQANCCFLIQFTYTVLFCFIRPYKSRKTFLYVLFNELILVAAFFLVVLLYNVKTGQLSTVREDSINSGFVFLVLILILTNSIKPILETLINLTNVAIKRCCKKEIGKRRIDLQTFAQEDISGLKVSQCDFNSTQICAIDEKSTKMVSNIERENEEKNIEQDIRSRFSQERISSQIYAQNSNNSANKWLNSADVLKLRSEVREKDFYMKKKPANYMMKGLKSFSP